jgi:E3 ubiquitin-protein ligase UBR4
LHSEILLASNKLETWDFSRKGAWLSLILSLINTGEKTDVDSHEQSLLGKSFAKYISENSGHCLSVLSSLLETYLLTFREAYLSLVDRGRHSKDHCHPSLLLKHSAFDKSKHHILLEKVGSNMEMLDRLCDLPARIDGVATKLGEVQKNCFPLKCLLHGFPSEYASSNSALLSCILVIHEIIHTFDGYIKIMQPGDRDQVDVDVISKLLSMVMAVRSDRIFRSIYGQCDAIFMSLINHRDDLAGYTDLFTLKQLEGFLADVNSKESIDHETEARLTKGLSIFWAERTRRSEPAQNRR